jgi:hypothetical protein
MNLSAGMNKEPVQDVDIEMEDATKMTSIMDANSYK